jgi:predicted N-acetyltransferase YhbS
MSEVVVEMCDPREHEAELKELFARNGKPDFDNIFQRVYTVRAAQGLRSWIGRVGGRAVSHIAVTPIRFGGAGQNRMGGVLGDLMVDEAHRDFWIPVRLLRTMVADLKRAGEVSFLITTTVADAEPVFKAGGFKPLGSLHRYVMPLMTPYLWFSRLKSGLLRVGRARVLTGADRHVQPVAPNDPYFRPITDTAFYDSRIPRSEWTDLSWLNIDPAASVLVGRHSTDPELRLVDVLANNARDFKRGLHAGAHWGCRQVSTNSP